MLCKILGPIPGYFKFASVWNIWIFSSLVKERRLGRWHVDLCQRILHPPLPLEQILSTPLLHLPGATNLVSEQILAYSSALDDCPGILHSKK